ncbi:hypothetical protein ALP01_200090 [Pseudomonas caricapapayae]|nr:hypothetical protein ALP01_200090 [Pseudomonas caricapapayae]
MTAHTQCIGHCCHARQPRLLRAHRPEQRSQTARHFASLLGQWQVALGEHLDFDQQELTLFGRLALVQRMLGQLEPASGFHLPHTALTLHTTCLGFTLLDLYAAQPLAPVLFLPAVLALILVTLQRLRC